MLGPFLDGGAWLSRSRHLQRTGRWSGGEAGRRGTLGLIARSGEINNGSRPSLNGAPMNTRTIAILALVIAVILVILIFAR